MINLANTNNGNLFILPREAESAFDYRQRALGSGPYYISEYVPSVRFVYKRNPGYYDKERPYIDTVEMPIVGEYASALAQFKAGAIYSYAVRGEDMLDTKREIPSLVLHQGDVSVSLLRFFFGWKAVPPDKTPFRDERVRQAFSMSWDRDLWIDVFYNIQKYEQEGIPLETRWNSAVQGDNFAGWWVDPKSKEFGPDAKYYQHDIAEAKKLLTAAGFPNGLDADSYHITTAENGVDFPRQVETLLGMAQDAGLRIKISPVAFANEYQRIRDAKGNFEGMSARLSAVVGYLDVGDKLYHIWNSKGALFTGFDPDGRLPTPSVKSLTSRNALLWRSNCSGSTHANSTR
jgi:peptide/nickel transport system substrate-binding protein